MKQIKHLECKYCQEEGKKDKLWASEHGLQKHMKKAHGVVMAKEHAYDAKPKKYFCDQCAAGYSTKEGNIKGSSLVHR